MTLLFIVAELTVIRDAGFFGTVTVPYMIESAGANDLSPTSGLLVFEEGITQLVTIYNHQSMIEF